MPCCISKDPQSYVMSTFLGGHSHDVSRVLSLIQKSGIAPCLAAEPHGPARIDTNKNAI